MMLPILILLAFMCRNLVKIADYNKVRARRESSPLVRSLSACAFSNQRSFSVQNVITGFPSRSSAFSKVELSHSAQISTTCSGIVRINSNLVDPHFSHFISASLSFEVNSLMLLSIEIPHKVFNDHWL